jgi:hypothetical protein
MADTRPIERDIEGTRRDMGRTLLSIERRVSPERLLNLAVYYATSAPAGRRIAAALGRTVVRHPLPVALLGIGLGWLAFEMKRGGAAPEGAARPAGRRLYQAP